MGAPPGTPVHPASAQRKRKRGSTTLGVVLLRDTITAIGSAAAIGFLIAFFGAAGFLFTGSYLKTNLPLSIGFLNIPAFLIFFPITAFMARLGAKASHRINKKKDDEIFWIIFNSYWF